MCGNGVSEEQQAFSHKAMCPSSSLASSPSGLTRVQDSSRSACTTAATPSTTNPKASSFGIRDLLRVRPELPFGLKVCHDLASPPPPFRL